MLGGPAVVVVVAAVAGGEVLVDDDSVDDDESVPLEHAAEPTTRAVTSASAQDRPGPMEAFWPRGAAAPAHSVPTRDAGASVRGPGIPARSERPVVTVTDVMAAHGHEQVVFVADAPTGLRAVIAVHSTALGPSLGGIRFWRYASEADAVADVLRLSEAMTLKASAAGLHQGGGKAVVLVDDPDASRTVELLHGMGRAIDELGGRYVAAEDVGATTRDMDLIDEVTPWVTGVSPDRGGSGDPSPITAVGVVAAMRATMRELDGTRDLAGRRVAVQGTGHVGSSLAGLLVDAGASVLVADLNEAKAHAVADASGATVVDPDQILVQECDVLAPCALGGAVTARSVDSLRCRAICGAANLQLEDDRVDDLLAERGIVYAPDFVANAGGIINIAEEFSGYSLNAARQRVEAIEATTTRVFDLARARDISPGRAAVALARERIEREGAGRRWAPGDPAAWTDGAPLRELRPAAPRSPALGHGERTDRGQ
jgi:leucine dehydrogenase